MRFTSFGAILLATAVAGCSTMMTTQPPDGAPDWTAVAGGVGYSLPKALVRVTLTRTGEEYSIAVGEPAYVADTRFNYLLRYRPSSFSSDTLEVKIDPKTGLLGKIDVKAEDKLDDIIVEIAKSLAIPEAATTEAGAVVLDRVLDPADEKAVEKLQADMNAAARPRSIAFSVQRPPPYAAASADCSVGACYRRSVPYGIAFSFDGKYFYDTVVSLPNDMPALVIALDRTPFVTRVHKAEFENGMLKEHHVEKPSEALEIASLPLTVAKAILKVPAEILQLKMDLSDKEKGLAEKEKARIEAERELKKTQAMKAESGTSIDRALIRGGSDGRRVHPPLGAQGNTWPTPDPNGPLVVDQGSAGTLPPRPATQPKPKG